MRRLLSDVVQGREQKIMLIEVANEAWQNGFPGAGRSREEKARLEEQRLKGGGLSPEVIAQIE